MGTKEIAPHVAGLVWSGLGSSELAVVAALFRERRMAGGRHVAGLARLQFRCIRIIMLKHIERPSIVSELYYRPSVVKATGASLRDAPVAFLLPSYQDS